MRLAFLGTPREAVASLRALVEDGHDVVVVVTRRDQRRGRGGAWSPSPVKAAAVELGIPVVHQVSDLAEVDVERGIVVAYGAMIPGPVLARTPMLNVHFSLLPRWRGAAPVERALLAGDEATGVSIMSLDEGLDTGPVHLVRRIPIGESTAPELRSALAVLGAEALIEVLDDPDLLAHPVRQSGEATYAAKLDQSDLHLLPSMTVDQLLRVVRLGRAWVLADGRRLLVLAARRGGVGATSTGTIEVVDDTIALVGESGAVTVDLLRPEGSRTMSSQEWWRGRPAPARPAVWG